jgi:NADPH-dependent glutamate synthase beta subunit-like oxidoreductase
MSVQSLATLNASPRLIRSLTLTHAVLYGLGVTIGAGIYVLVGLAVGSSGMHAPLAFMGAAFVMVFSAAWAGLFFSTGCHQASDLSQSLGCKRDEKGGVVTDPATEETSVPGVYVAGDVSRDVLLVSIAIAEGAKAAVAINRAFLRRGGFCD